MQIQATPLACDKCRYTWMGQLMMNCPFRLAIAAMRAIRCPKCHADWRNVTMVPALDYKEQEN